MAGERPKTRVAVQIFNQQYTLVGEESKEYLEMLAAYVDQQMQEVARRHAQLSPLKVAVLAALNMADTLSGLREDYEGLLRLIEEEKKASSYRSVAQKPVPLNSRTM